MPGHDRLDFEDDTGDALIRDALAALSQTRDPDGVHRAVVRTARRRVARRRIATAALALAALVGVGSVATTRTGPKQVSVADRPTTSVVDDEPSSTAVAAEPEPATVDEFDRMAVELGDGVVAVVLATEKRPDADTVWPVEPAEAATRDALDTARRLGYEPRFENLGCYEDATTYLDADTVLGIDEPRYRDLDTQGSPGIFWGLDRFTPDARANDEPDYAAWVPFADETAAQAFTDAYPDPTVATLRLRSWCPLDERVAHEAATRPVSALTESPDPYWVVLAAGPYSEENEQDLRPDLGNAQPSIDAARAAGQEPSWEGTTCNQPVGGGEVHELLDLSRSPLGEGEFGWMLVVDFDTHEAAQAFSDTIDPTPLGIYEHTFICDY